MLVASGFNRLGPLRKNAGNQDVASSHNEVLTEMTNIVGAAFLGVTVGCARCHDHKFDPFRQSDYYRLQAYFAQTQPNDVVLASQEEQARMEGQGRADRAGDAPAASATAARAGRREGQTRNAARGARRQDAGAARVHLQRDRRRRRSASPIQILFHGDYLNPVAKVGMRPLGILLPEGAPEAPHRHRRSRGSSWRSGSPIRRIRSPRA